MNTYIVLLRGINVSGQKKIKMAELKLLLEKQGFLDVSTYIQSGNIVLNSSESTPTQVAFTIEEIIQKKYNFHVPTLVITPNYLHQSFKECPYIAQPNLETKKLYFAFLYAIPEKENIDKLNSYTFEGEEFILNNTMVYLNYEVGAGKAKMSNNFIENKLKVTSTARNYNTVVKLIEMSQ